jgi:hypothetical protein
MEATRLRVGRCAREDRLAYRSNQRDDRLTAKAASVTVKRGYLAELERVKSGFGGEQIDSNQRLTTKRGPP